MGPSLNSSVPDRTMLQSLSTHLNHPSKLRESAIVIRRRWLSQLFITALPSSFVKVSALAACWTSVDIHEKERERDRWPKLGDYDFVDLATIDRNQKLPLYFAQISVSGESRIYIFNPLYSTFYVP